MSNYLSAPVFYREKIPLLVIGGGASLIHTESRLMSALIRNVTSAGVNHICMTHVNKYTIDCSEFITNIYVFYNNLIYTTTFILENLRFKLDS